MRTWVTRIIKGQHGCSQEWGLLSNLFMLILNEQWVTEKTVFRDHHPGECWGFQSPGKQSYTSVAMYFVCVIWCSLIQWLACTHTCVCKLCVGVYRCEHMHLGAREQLCVLYYTPRYFSRQCLLLNLELANSARLAGQRGPKVLLSPPTPSAGIIDTYPVFLCWF